VELGLPGRVSRGSDRTKVWIFDVDACLVDSLTGTSLRPGSVTLLEHLRADACRVLWWSAGGADYARRRAEQQGVVHLIDGFYDKDGRDAEGRYLTAFLDDVRNVVFVDDRPEDMPTRAEVIAVAPYLVGNPHDRGLAPAARRAGLYT
jgi:long-chain acyl-CoA synthetase